MKNVLKKIIFILLFCLFNSINVKATVYTITLDNQYATSKGTTVIYESYGKGFCLDNKCSNKITDSKNNITVPTRTGEVNGLKVTYTFGGYYYADPNGLEVQYINSKGYLTSDANTSAFSANGKLYAKWYEWVVEYKNNYYLKADKTNKERVFQETAYAYYMRGTYIQYDLRKLQQGQTPEVATSEETKYITCAPFFTNIYTDILKTQYELHMSASGYSKYGITYKDGKEVIVYGDKTNMTFKNSDGTTDVIKYADMTSETNKQKLLETLQIGDALSYNNESTGDAHTFMIYELIYDASGKVVDAVIIESAHGNAGNIFYPNTKVLLDANTIGYSYYASMLNKYTGIVEGSIRVELFSSYSKGLGTFGTDSRFIYSIIRLLTDDGKGELILNYTKGYTDAKGNKFTFIDKPVKIVTTKNETRYNHPKLYIEKTVDKFSNTTVNPLEILEYSITIKNNSNSDYMYDIPVSEDINSSRVTFVSNTTENSDLVKYNGYSKGYATWTVGKLSAGQKVVIKYKVKVKSGILGKTIACNGTVGNIATVVRNTVGNNLSNTESTSLTTGFNKAISDGYTGLDLIEQAYKNAGLITNLNLDNVLTSDYSSKSKYKDYLIYDTMDSCNSDSAYTCFKSSSLNESHPLYSAVLDLYWNKTGKINPKSTTLKYGYTSVTGSGPYVYDMKLNTGNSRYTIFEEHFKVGDILLYINSNDVRYDKTSKTFVNNTYEDGLYAFMYVQNSDCGKESDGKTYKTCFVGVNLGNDGKKSTNDDRNYFTKAYYVYKNLTLVGKSTQTLTTTNKPLDYYGNVLDTSFFNYDTLYGKDSFVILRPSLLLNRSTVTVNAKSNLVFNDTEQDLVTINNTENLNVCLSFSEIDSCSKTSTNLTKKEAGTYKVYYYVSGNNTYFPVKGSVNVTINENASILKDKLEKKYKIKDKYVSGFKLNDTLLNIKSNVGLDFKTEKSNSIIGTGTVLKYNDENYEAVVYGDLNGDGKINSADLLKIRQHLLGTSELKGAYKEASLLNDDDLINSADLLSIRQHLLGTKLIEK